MQIRDRIKELRRVKASELLPNPRNWRTHPVAQQDALRGVLAEVGYADALIARETPDGLMLVDGHLRAETTPDADVPVLVLDIDEAEADLMLATLDPLAAMAGRDEERLTELLSTVSSDNDTVNALLETLANGYEPLTIPEPEPPSEVEQGTLLALLDVTADDPRHEVARGDIWKLGGRHTLVCASVITDSAIWLPYLDSEGVWFCPHPGPMVPLADEAERTTMLLVQPDTYVAGHMLDCYEDIRGAAAIAQVTK